MAAEPRKSILWVDDHVDSFTGIIERLGNNGFEVSTASSLPEAEARLRRRKFDIILTDLSLSFDGTVNVLDELRTHCPGSIIVVVTAYMNTDYLKAAAGELRNDLWVISKRDLDTSTLDEVLIHPLKELAVRSDPKAGETIIRLAAARGWPQLRLRFGEPNGPELVGDFDAGSQRSFVSYEWLFDNGLIQADTSASPHMLLTVHEKRMVALQMTRRCLMNVPVEQVRLVDFRFYAVMNWGSCPLARPATGRVALIGRDFLSANNLGLEIAVRDGDSVATESLSDTGDSDPIEPRSPSHFDLPRGAPEDNSDKRFSARRPRTVIGKAVVDNEEQIAPAAAALMLLLEQRLATLREMRPNSNDARRERDEEIAHYEALKRQLNVFMMAAQSFIRGKDDEARAVASTRSFADGVLSWWTKRHQQICDRTFEMALFFSAVGVCSLAGAGGALSVSVSGALVGGKPVVEAIKSIGKHFGKDAST